MKKILSTAAALLISAQLATSQVVINEVSTNSDTIEVFGQTADWIELYNPSSGWVYLNNFAISDNPDKPQKWRLDGTYKIEPNGYLIILCNDLASGANTNFKLSAEGETIVISNSLGDIIDQVEVPHLMSDQSYGRVYDGKSTWGVFKSPTPNSTNNSSKAITVSPKMDIQGGFYAGAQNITITCADPDATIYYTLDGSMPTEKSSVYKSPINIVENKVLRAAAKNPTLDMSYATTNTFFIRNRSFDIPVVSLSTDPDNFFDDKIGIYVRGTNGKEGNCADGKVNWNQDWERPVHFEYFTTLRKQVVSVDAGVKIFGHCSRTNEMKSLRIVARKDEYGEKKIEYKFFEHKDIDKFKSLVLRNGGNDFRSTMLRDGLITQLCSKYMDADIQEFQPVAVYLNGEYFGMHNLRERVSDHYVQENYGIDHEKVDLLENNAEIIEGSNKEYQELINYVKQHSLKDDNNFKYVSSRIDIDNFTDYYIAQLYVDNEDWPNNNIKYWKTQGTNSRWRWILFGTEYSCGVYGGQPSTNSIKRVLVEHDTQLGNSGWSSVLIKAMLENEAYKAMFLQRFSYHIDHTFQYDNVSKLCDSLKYTMDNEWDHHNERWLKWINNQAWTNNVNGLKNWFKNRPSYIRDHLSGVFNLGGTFKLTARSDNSNAKILFSGFKTNLPISGTYYKNMELKLEAKIPSGYAFDHWAVKKNGTTQNVTSYPLVLKTDTDTEVTLVTKAVEQKDPEPRTERADGLVINEISSKNGGQIADEYNSYPGWIEIMNPTGSNIDLAGLFIGNGKDYYYIPESESENTILKPGARVVFFADKHPEKGIFHMNFELSTSGGTVELVQMLTDKTESIDKVKYPKLSKNQSFGYKTDCTGELVTFAEGTPYAANGGKIVEPVPFYIPEKNLATPTEAPVEHTITVSVYPNPAKEYLTIKGCSDNPQWTIITLNGSSVKSGRGVNADLTDLKSGYYLVRITDNGKTSVVKLLKI